MPKKSTTKTATKTSKKSATKLTTKIYRLKITLCDVQPEIFRTIEIDGTASLYELHRAIQAAMDWKDCHMHLFQVGKQYYGEPDDDGFGTKVHSEDDTTIAKLLPKAGQKMFYTYDMGDSWRHDLKVEEIFAAEPDVQYPRCVGGANACPPEDCGGAPGYEYLLEILADSTHEEHEEMLDWVGGPFDPTTFDLKAADKAVRRCS